MILECRYTIFSNFDLSLSLILTGFRPYSPLHLHLMAQIPYYLILSQITLWGKHYKSRFQIRK